MPVDPAPFHDLGLLLVDDDDALKSFGLRLSPPAAGVRVEVDAASAFEIATTRLPETNADGVPSVVLAVGRREWGWSDGGPLARLIYLVRWQNVTWIPSGGPAPGPGQTPREPRAVHGPRTTLVDADTGALLGSHLCGVEPNEGGKSAAGPSTDSDRDRETLLSRWADRPSIGPAVGGKLAAAARRAARQVVEACASLAGSPLRERLAQIGTDLAATLCSVDDAVGPFLTSRERSEVIADLERAVDAAERQQGHALPDGRQALIRATAARLEQRPPQANGNDQNL